MNRYLVDLYSVSSYRYVDSVHVWAMTLDDAQREADLAAETYVDSEGNTPEVFAWTVTPD